MKKLNLLFAFAMLFSVSLSAQVDVKINPIGALFNSPDVSAEYNINEDIGVELTVGLEYGNVGLISGIEEVEYKKSGYKVRLSGKYYFGPEDGCDKFYAGLYLGPRSFSVNDDDGDAFDVGYKQSAFTAGLLGGFKWVSSRNIIFEIGIGAGRAFNEKIVLNDDTNTVTIPTLGLDFIGTLAVGYRFGAK